jgi:ABC-type branched-subunit amino acid transport system ATPase component
MDLVMTVSDRVTVLNYGRRIASGPPPAVQTDPAVLEAYLGGTRAVVERPGPTASAISGGPLAGRPDAPPAAAPPLLSIDGVAAAYGRMEVLHGISLEVRRGEIVVVVGANGSGKTTTLRTVAGLLRPTRGAIHFEGRPIAGRRAHWLARHGIALVPEGRLVFPDHTVLDNLRLGAYGRRDADVGADIESQLDRFPILRDRRSQPAGTLSGGEQQMLAIARSLMARPRLLLLDEPSLGLAPRLVEQVFAGLARLRAEGLTLLIVEQMAEVALAIADRGYVLEQGRIVLGATADELQRDEQVAAAYLGRRTGGPAWT